MSKVSPCLWFDGEAEDAANFYVSLLPDSNIETVQRNVVDGPGGSAGSVLVVEFTLAGQRFMALNGGMRFEYTHAVSVKDRLRRPGRGRPVVGDSAVGRWPGRPLRLAQDRYGVSWQIMPTALPKYFGGQNRAGAQRAMAAMLQMVKLDVEGLERAYEGRSAA